MTSSRNCLSLLALGAVLAAGSRLHAQVIPPVAKTAADAAPHRKEIDDYIKVQIKKMTSGKSDQVTSGRDSLERESVTAGGASASYLTVYAEVLNANLLPLATDKNVSTRLNAAIVNAKVAAKDPSPALAPSTMKFVDDPTEVISMWGLKAARPVLPAAIAANAPQTAALMASISGAVKRFPLSGSIAEEAYKALRVDAGVNVANPIVQAVIPDMLAVMRTRVAAYQRALPGLPSADNQGVSFVALRAWGLLTAAQQKEVVQLLSDLAGAQGQHIQNMSGSTRNELLESTKVSGGAFQVIGGAIKDATITEAGKALQSIGVPTGGEEIRVRADAIYPALIHSARFKDLKEPPKVDTSTDKPDADDSKADESPKAAAPK